MKELLRRPRTGVSVMVLAVTMAASLAAPDSADALSYFDCAPSHPGAFSNRVHVLCATPAEGYIYYFAVCSTQDSAFASRALSAFTTAVVTGKSLRIYYEPTDDSGISCGCAAQDCRALTGVEVLP